MVLCLDDGRCFIKKFDKGGWLPPFPPHPTPTPRMFIGATTEYEAEDTKNI